MKYLLVILMLWSCTHALENFENVVFHRLNEVFVTRAKWLVSFHIELGQFDRALRVLGDDLKNMWEGISKGQLINRTALGTPYSDAFIAILEQAKKVSLGKERLVKRYHDIISINHRQKRSVIPIVGKALGYLFGMASDSDMQAVNKAILNLKTTQKGVVHLLEDSISMVNITRKDVDQNRRAINALIKGLGGSLHTLEKSLVTTMLRWNNQENATQLLWRYNLLLERLFDSFSIIDRALDFLEIQLGSLSRGKLTPNIITPVELRRLLEGVSRTLPADFKLPKRPGDNIWYFYHTLKCNTLFFNRSIVIITHIPLVDTEHTYEIYRILNFPLPLSKRPGSKQTMGWTARYQLDSNAIAVNRDRTRYSLLTESETTRCMDRDVRLCDIESPIYLSSGRESCELALLRKDRDEVIRVCRSRIKTNTRLPWAIRVSSKAWVLASARKETFTIRCRDGTQREVSIQTPLGTIHIKPGCSAYNRAVVLTAQIEGESSLKEINYHELPIFNVSDATVWRPLRSIIPTIQNITLPAELEEIESVPTIKVLQQLKRLEQTDTWPKGMPLWVVGIITGTTGSILLISFLLIFCLCKYRSKIRRERIKMDELLRMSVIKQCAKKNAGIEEVTPHCYEIPKKQYTSVADNSGIIINPESLTAGVRNTLFNWNNVK